MTCWDKEQGRWEPLPWARPALGWGGGQGPQGLCSVLGTVSPASSAPAPWPRVPRGGPGVLSCAFWLPCIVCSGKREGQSSGQSSAPDTRWLRGSSRFSKMSSHWLPLSSPLVGSAAPVLCRVRAALADWQEGEWARAQGSWHGSCGQRSQ